MNRHASSGKRGFTLVEVTIAIGIAAFGIVSLLGLMGVFMTSGRESFEDTVLSDIAKGVAANLRSRPFDPPSSGADNSLGASTPPLPVYFNGEGSMVLESASPLYTCTVTLTQKPEFNTVSTNAVNLYEAKIEFSWPYPQNTFKKTFHINLARHAN